MTGHEAETQGKMSQEQNELFLYLKHEKLCRVDTMLTGFLSSDWKFRFRELCLKLEVEIEADTLLISQTETTHAVCYRAI